MGRVRTAALGLLLAGALGCDPVAAVGPLPGDGGPDSPDGGGPAQPDAGFDAGILDDETGGTPPPDAGDADLDAGLAAPDAGQGPTDAGQPPADGGSAIPDAGLPPPPNFQVVFSTRAAANARDTAVEAALVGLMDLALPGSKLRLEMYTFTRAAPADALIRAHQRGVDVRVVVDGAARSAPGSEVPRLETALGLARVKSCSAGGGGGSCQGTGIMHNKVLLLSALADGSRNVVAQASHNFSTAQLTMHNNAVIVRNDPALFAAYEQTFNDLAADVENLAYYRSADGTLATRAYFFPRGSGGDTIVSILGNITCDATAKVRVAMAFFTSARQAIADALSARQAEGCDVALVVGDDEIPFTAQVSSAVSVTRYPQRTGGWGLHSKYLLIDAKYAGSTTHRRLVFTGSHNYTGPALTSNDETLLRVEDPAVYQAYLADWSRVKAAALTP